jgi:hypothetical protein
VRNVAETTLENMSAFDRGDVALNAVTSSLIRGASEAPAQQP